jgi:hypothetical protein
MHVILANLVAAAGLYRALLASDVVAVVAALILADVGITSAKASAVEPPVAVHLRPGRRQPASLRSARLAISAFSSARE